MAQKETITTRAKQDVHITPQPNKRKRKTPTHKNNKS